MNQFLELLSFLVLIGCFLMPVSAGLACRKEQPRLWWMFCLGVAALVVATLGTNETVMNAMNPQSVTVSASLLSLILPVVYCAACVLSVVVYAIANVFTKRK